MIYNPSSIIENNLLECFSGLLGVNHYFDDKMHLQWNNTGLKTPLFNFVFRFNCAPGFEQQGIDIIKQSFAKSETSCVWVLGPSTRPTDMDTLFQTNNIQPYKSAKGMLFNLQSSLINEEVDQDIQIIRVKTREELHLWAEIVGTAFHFEPPLACLPVVENLSNNYQFNRPYIFFLAYYQGEPAGAAMLYQGSNNTVGHFRDSVLPDHRNQGIGTALVRARLEYAKDNGFTYSVAHCLPSSAGLYERQGFKPHDDYNLYIQNYTSF